MRLFISNNMGKRGIKLYLDDIIESSQKILNYTENLVFEGFEADQKTIDAVVKNFEIIGEAAKNIPQEIMDKYPHINWLSMISMRNILVHEYWGTDLEIVWQTIKENIPQIEYWIKELINELEDKEQECK